MALRLIEINHKKGKSDEIDFLLKDLPILNMWHDQLPEGETITKVLIKVENTDRVLDVLQQFFSEEYMRIVILPVEATLPRPEGIEPEKGTEDETEKVPQRISIEELYQKMTRVSVISKRYIIMAILAAFVAAIGLLKNDVAVIIGSMVIAPLLSPNMALALATTLADTKLAARAIKTSLLGFAIAIAIGFIAGAIVNADPEIPQIASRSDVSLYYILIALATGIAGAYSITTGVAEALVGVMVAVALLPPLVTSGLLLGSRHLIDASGAFLLFLVNVASINLSGVITFLLQGIRPQKWWEKEKGRKAVRYSIIIWITILLALALLIMLEQQIKISQ
jgi:uncharacterized hydrophobic protein (TIGR00341 family)